MSLELKSDGTEFPKPKKKEANVFLRAVEIAKKYPDLPYLQARNKIREETPCSKTTAHKAYTRAKAERKDDKQDTGAAKTPQITIVDEKEKKAEFLETEKEPETLETLTEEETPAAAQKLLTEGELSAEDMASLFDAANDGIRMFSAKYAPSEKSAKMLGKLWFRPFNKFWSQVSEQNPLLAIAIVTTIIIYLPALIGAVTDWRKQTKKTKETESKE
jgi:hypothetical protein